MSVENEFSAFVSILNYKELQDEFKKFQNKSIGGFKNNFSLTRLYNIVVYTLHS